MLFGLGWSIVLVGCQRMIGFDVRWQLQNEAINIYMRLVIGFFKEKSVRQHVLYPMLSVH